MSQFLEVVYGPPDDDCPLCRTKSDRTGGTERSGEAGAPRPRGGPTRTPLGLTLPEAQRQPEE